MLWNTFETYRERLADQYRSPEYNSESGMSFEELKTVAYEIFNDCAAEPFCVVRSKIIRHILENARIGVVSCEWFNDRIDQRGLVEYFKKKAWDEHFESIADLFDAHRYEIERCAYSAWGDFGHTAPDWSAILSLGYRGLYERAQKAKNEKLENGTLDAESEAFYDSVFNVYEGIFSYLRRLAQEARIKGKENEKQYIVADNLELLSYSAPTTMMQAMQSIFVYYTLQQFVETTYVRTLGTLDVLLYPYYKADLESGRYSKEQLRELVRYFIFKMGAVHATANMPFAIGGVDENGKGYVNELSYIIIDEYHKLGVYDPKIHVRYTEEMPDKFLRCVLDCIRDGNSSIVFINSPVVTKALENLGIEHSEAVNYTIVGCYETCAAGVEVPCTCNARINIPKAVEAALGCGVDMLENKMIGVSTPDPDDFHDFESFVSAVKSQLDYFIDNAIELTNAIERGYDRIHSSPIFSSTFLPCVEKGRDIYASGAKYNNSSINAFGIATAADSLVAIKRLVFEEKKMTLGELAEILRSNFEGHEMLRLRIQKTFPKYGNNSDEVDLIARDILAHCSDRINGRENGRGGVYRMGAFSIDWRIEYGAKTAASADGRLAGEPISKNVCADTARDVMGATAHILSAVKLDYEKIPNGTVLDLLLHSSAVAGEDGMRAFLSTLRTFMSRGGFAIQYNVFTPEVLREAQRDPKKYATLQVRLCGWNVLFVNLSKLEQDEFIRGAEAVS